MLNTTFGFWGSLRAKLRHEHLRRIGVRVVTQPAAEQLSLDDARAHLRLDAFGSPPEHYDDTWLTDIGIPLAREYIEGETALSLVPVVLEASAAAFPSCTYHEFFTHGGSDALVLPFGPVVGVESLIYTDTTGVDQTLDPALYVLDNVARPAYLMPAYGSNWPGARPVPNSVRVRYHAGHTLSGDSPNDYPMPRALYGAMLLALGHFYENRENTSDARWLKEIPLGVAQLVAPYSLEDGFA